MTATAEPTTKAEMTTVGADTMERLIIGGDLSKLSHGEKVRYYLQVCEGLGLNPITKPFELLKLQGKEQLYATKECAAQLRKIHNVSISKPTFTFENDCVIAAVDAEKPEGDGVKRDADVGAVSIKGLSGEAYANAVKKSVTQSKRRVTLSICGLGFLDESEVDSIPGSQQVSIEPDRPEPGSRVDIITRIGKRAEADPDIKDFVIKEVKRLHGPEGRAKELTLEEAETLLGSLEDLEAVAPTIDEPVEAQGSL